MVMRYGAPGPAFGVAGRYAVGRGAWISPCAALGRARDPT